MGAAARRPPLSPPLAARSNADKPSPTCPQTISWTVQALQQLLNIAVQVRSDDAATAEARVVALH